MALHSWKREGLIILLILAVLIGFFWDVLLGGKVLLTCNPSLWYPWRYYASKADLESRTYRTDSALTYLPRMAYLHDCLRSGRPPLWNPYIFMGFPFWADPQSRALYPIQLVLALLDPHQAMGIDIFVHFFMAIFGMYLFLKTITSDRLASLVGGFAFGFSGFMTTRMGHPTFVATTSWIPWVFFAYKLVERSSRFSILVLAVCFAMSYLAGFPQITFFGLGSLLLYSVWMGAEELLSKRDASQLKRGLIGIVGAGLIALFLVSATFLPFVEFLRNSKGLGIGFQDMVRLYVSNPWLLARAAFPQLFGNPIERTSWLQALKPALHPYNTLFIVYVGTGGLLVALGSLGFIKSCREIRFFWFLLLLVVGMGTSGRFFKVFYSLIPIFRIAQIDRICVLANFALASILAIGLSKISNSSQSQRRGFLILVVLIGMLFIIGLLVLGFDATDLYQGISDRMRSIQARLSGESGFPMMAQRWFENSPRFAETMMKAARQWTIVMLTATVLLTLALISRTKARSIFRSIFVLFCLFDLLYVARSYYVSQVKRLEPTESIRLLRDLTSSSTGWRVEAFMAERGVLPQNTNSIFDIPSVRGLSTVSPLAFGEFASCFGTPRIIGGSRKTVGTYTDVGCARFLVASDLDTSLVMSRLMRLIASRKQPPIRTVTIGGKPMIAFETAIGSPIDLDAVLPQAERLNLYLGFDQLEGGACVVAMVQVEKVGSNGQRPISFEKEFQAEDCRNWHKISLDISGLNDGEVHLKICCLGEKSESTRCYWGGFEIVKADCQVRKTDNGYEIVCPGKGGIQGVLAIEIKASGLVPLELLMPQKIVRFIDFRGRPGFQSILVEVPNLIDKVVLRSTEQFEVDDARLVQVDGSLPVDFRPIHISDMVILENMAALPRGLVLSKGYFEVDGGRKEAVFLGGSITDALCGRARIQAYTPTKVSIDVEADQPGYLLFQDIHYPGWAAFVDGQPAPIYKINGLRCIEVDRGKHQVVMHFRPKSLIIGCVFSIIGIAICSLSVIREQRRCGANSNA